MYSNNSLFIDFCHRQGTRALLRHGTTKWIWHHQLAIDIAPKRFWNLDLQMKMKKYHYNPWQASKTPWTPIRSKCGASDFSPWCTLSQYSWWSVKLTDKRPAQQNIGRAVTATRPPSYAHRKISKCSMWQNQMSGSSSPSRVSSLTWTATSPPLLNS